MEKTKIICDHGNEIELRMINGELNISIISQSDEYQKRTAPISSKRQLKALIFNLEQFRDQLK